MPTADELARFIADCNQRRHGRRGWQGAVQAAARRTRNAPCHLADETKTTSTNSAAQETGRASRLAREARLRLLRLARSRDTLTTVEGVDQRTSVNDARIALCAALGVDLDDIDLTSGHELTRQAYENTRYSWRWNIQMHGWSDWWERNLNEALSWWRERRPEFVDGDDWLAGILKEDQP